jgi:hypothetical protein
MATVRTANAAQSRINMVLYGGHGAGKSTYALGAAYLKREDGKPFRILYIDNEMGSVDDYVSDLEENGIGRFLSRHSFNDAMNVSSPTEVRHIASIPLPEGLYSDL